MSAALGGEDGLRALAAAGLGILALFAIIKATNEPAISNKWTFYLPAEAVAFGAHQIVGHFGVIGGLATIAAMYGTARYFERRRS